MANTAKQAKGMKWLFWTGFSCAVLAFLSLFVAFATPFWIQSWRRVHSPLANTGLWQICLSGYIKPRDPTLRAYVGCWWIHTTVFHDIIDALMPHWFRLVQAFTILGILAIIVAAILLVLFRPEETRKKLYGDSSHRLMFVNAALLLITAAMILIDSLVFAMKTKDPYWMPRPHLNYLSWSFGFNVLAGFFAAYGGICVTLIALILKEMKEEGTMMPWQPKVEATKPMRSIPPPPSETSSKSFGTTSQVSQPYPPPAYPQEKPYAHEKSYAHEKPYTAQYYPSSAPIDNGRQQQRPSASSEKPYVAQYRPTTAPIDRSQPQHDYAPRKPHVQQYKPSQPPIDRSYDQTPRSHYTPSYQPAYSMPVKRVPKSSQDDSKESDV